MSIDKDTFTSSLYTLHLMENLQSEDIHSVKVSFSLLRTSMYDTWVVHCTLLTHCTMAYSEDFKTTLSYSHLDSSVLLWGPATWLSDNSI